MPIYYDYYIYMNSNLVDVSRAFAVFWYRIFAFSDGLSNKKAPKKHNKSKQNHDRKANSPFLLNSSTAYLPLTREATAKGTGSSCANAAHAAACGAGSTEHVENILPVVGASSGASSGTSNAL